jgi:aquaporin Z
VYAQQGSPAGTYGQTPPRPRTDNAPPAPPWYAPESERNQRPVRHRTEEPRLSPQPAAAEPEEVPEEPAPKPRRRPRVDTGELRASLTEFVGTFFLVLAGAGATLTSALYKSPGTLGIAMVFGAVLTVLVIATRGAHFNPAVTLGTLIADKLDRDKYVSEKLTAKTALYKMFAQFTGGFLAALVLLMIYGGAGLKQSLGAATPATGFGFWSITFVELLFTAFLVFAILRSSVNRYNTELITGIAAGGALFVGILFASPSSGGSFNPAREFGPAFIGWLSGNGFGFWNFMAYMITPLIGGAIAAGVHMATKPNPNR